jgi:hypothetical protein
MAAEVTPPEAAANVPGARNCTGNAYEPSGSVCEVVTTSQTPGLVSLMRSTRWPATGAPLSRTKPPNVAVESKRGVDGVTWIVTSVVAAHAVPGPARRRASTRTARRTEGI